MAVTPTHDLPGRRQESDPHAQEGQRPEEHRTDDGTQGSGEADSKPPPGKSNKMKILGGVGVFLILALYFVWIGTEMGGHAISGTTEMVAIFGAILLGIGALVAGGALSRKTSSTDDEEH